MGWFKKIFKFKVNYDSNEILCINQVAQRLSLDRRTVRRVASSLGGRRFGNRWRFRWGAVLEYFDNAYIETGQRKLLDGTGTYKWQTDRQQDVPSREKRWPRMEGCKAMGGRSKEICLRKEDDPFGLGEAYLLGKRISKPRKKNYGKENH